MGLGVHKEVHRGKPRQGEGTGTALALSNRLGTKKASFWAPSL